MRRFLVLSGNSILIIAAVFCTMGALISSFSFGVDYRTLLLFWTTATLLLSVLATLWGGKGLLTLMPPAAADIYWKCGGAIEGAKWVLYYITREYNKWLNIPVLFPGARAGPVELTHFFAAAGIVLAFLLAITICLRRGSFLTVVFTVPFVLPTFVLINYPPDTRFLLGLLAVYLTQLFRSAIYPDKTAKIGGRPVFPALALAALLLAASYLIAPTDNNKRGELISSLDSRFRNIVAELGFTKDFFGAGWPDIATDIWRFNTDHVKISDAGPRVVSGKRILDISTAQSGTFYLRGYSMDSFDGRSWYGNSDAEAVMATQESLGRSMPALIAAQYSDIYPDGAPKGANMVINKSGDHSGIFYLPYFTPPRSDPLWPSRDAFYYSLGSDLYNVDFYYYSGSIPELASALPDGVGKYNLQEYRSYMLPQPQYTQVDASTAKGLRELARDAGIDLDAQRSEIVDMVAEYISSSARYTLSPSTIPNDEDFALYFLQVAKQGYCIHFATAATLMLRALGIPARFTSGFVVTVPAGSGDLKDVAVTDRQAHAWVEVYYDDIGWVPLEATPASAGTGIPQRTPHTSADSTPMPTGTPDISPTESAPAESPGVATTPSPKPDSAADAPENPEISLMTLVELTALVCAGAAAALMLRRFIAREYRKKRFRQADTNAAVICIWQYVLRLDRKNPPLAEMEGLALKARFSQHRISDNERAEMLDYALCRAEEVNKRHRLPGRIWLKWGKGL